MSFMEYPMYIGGEWGSTSERQTISLPYDGTPVATVFRASTREVERAVEAAKAAAPVMREMSRHERAAILRRAAETMNSEREALAMAVCNECGKPLREARAEVDRAVQTVLFSAEEAHRLQGEVVPMDAAPAGKGRWGITVREPLGVIAAITPFNFPLNLSMHKIGPAIAAGNAVVHKPASSTPLSALLAARIYAESGLPPGALNVVTGPGGLLGDLLVAHPDVAMITFTGSAVVGAHIRSIAGMKRVTLELGGNAALIIEPDADLDAAVPRAVTGAFAHSGQVCISVQRIFVQRGIRDEFIARLVAATGKLRIGHPHKEATEISSLISVAEAERVESWIEEARMAGAKLLCGGMRRRATIQPAILADAPAGVRACCREVFGPVVVVNSYETLDEAIERVNDSEYGLQAGIYTRDIEKAFRAARRIRTGGVHINEVPAYRVDQMPYGGVKMSGMGREGPRYAVEEMTELKLITWKV